MGTWKMEVFNLTFASATLAPQKGSYIDCPRLPWFPQPKYFTSDSPESVSPLYTTDCLGLLKTFKKLLLTNSPATYLPIFSSPSPSNHQMLVFPLGSNLKKKRGSSVSADVDKFLKYLMKWGGKKVFSPIICFLFLLVFTWSYYGYVYSFPRAVTTKNYKLHYNHRNLFSHSSGGWISEIKLSVEFTPFEKL